MRTNNEKITNIMRELLKIKFYNGKNMQCIPAYASKIFKVTLTLR